MEIESSNESKGFELQQLEAVVVDSSQIQQPRKRKRLIVFVNGNSGGKTGATLIPLIADKFGPSNVFDLSKTTPMKVLQSLLKQLPKFDEECNLAVCGGDGTLNWVLGTCYELELTPSIGIIPLGTGNDAARSFNWGFKFRSSTDVLQKLELMKTAEVVNWDRWHTKVKYSIPLRDKEISMLPPSVRLMKHVPRLYRDANADADADADDKKQINKMNDQILEFQWNNYLSFGVDAQIMSSFHHHREEHRQCYCCRCCTQTWMGYFGAINCLCCQASFLDIELEGKLLDSNEWMKIKLPTNLHGVVLMNIDAYAGGRKIWGNEHKSSDKENEYNISTTHPIDLADGLIEIVAIHSTCHLGMIIAKVQRGVRIGQFRAIRITSHTQCYVQFDGEPLDSSTPFTYEINRLPSAKMLYRSGEADPCC